MEYLKLQWEFITSQEWRRASMTARGGSASLLGFCFRKENDGRIAGAAGWDKRDWQAAADCTRRDVDAVVAAGLARWDGEDLIVHGYDHRGQAKFAIQRDQAEHGAKGAEHGKKGGRPPKEKPHSISPLENPPRGFLNNPPIPSHTTPDQPIPHHTTPSPAPRRDVNVDLVRDVKGWFVKKTGEPGRYLGGSLIYSALRIYGPEKIEFIAAKIREAGQTSPDDFRAWLEGRRSVWDRSQWEVHPMTKLQDPLTDEQIKAVVAA